MDRDSLHFVLADFDLAGMEAAADLYAERTNRFGDGLGATHGARRAIESGEKPIPEQLHLVAAGARELLPDGRVVRVTRCRS